MSQNNKQSRCAVVD